jgi:hypothetical protein
VVATGKEVNTLALGSEVLALVLGEMLTRRHELRSGLDMGMDICSNGLGGLTGQVLDKVVMDL